jgi:ATP:ADP antiporter, AAA family
MAIEGGVQHLPWMLYSTFVTLLLVTPFFGWLSARVSRYRLLLVVYAFFGLNLLFFFVAMMTPTCLRNGLPRVLRMAISVQSVRRVGVLECHGRSLYTHAGHQTLWRDCRWRQYRRNGWSASQHRVDLSHSDPRAVLVSIGFLTACGLCVYQLDRWATAQPARQVGRQGEPIGGSIWAGVRLALSLPYLLGVCLYLFLLMTIATFLYLEQMRLVGEQIPSPQGRTRMFALVDLVVNVLTFLMQVTVTSRVISRFGLEAALVVLPIVNTIGFGVIGVMPFLTVCILFTVMRRVGEYALAKPARAGAMRRLDGL